MGGEIGAVVIDGEKYFPSAAVPASRNFSLTIWLLPSYNQRGEEFRRRSTLGASPALLEDSF
jgi:hypothetical protein